MKQLFTGILASAMILSTVGMTFAQETDSVSAVPQLTQTLSSGTCGANATYSFDSSTGTMTISGYGNMEDYFTGPLASNVQSSASWGHYSSNIKSVVISQGITSIGNCAFAYCYNLTSVTIPNSVTRIGNNAFASCHDLTKVDIPDSVTSIDYAAFEGCYSLTSITLGNSVSSIGSGAFRSCRYLTNVYYGGSEADRAEIKINASNNGNSYLENATWIYTASPEYPDWATTFVDFVSAEIMPDISVSNYGEASNRGLIAQSLYNMFANGTDLVPSHSFTDVGDFATAITWCHGAEVMSGTGETTFGTYGNVNREQFCLILKQMASVLEKDTTSGDASSLGEYSDGWSVSDWAKEGVAWAVANGLMAGSNGSLNPHGDVTRLEVAIMLAAFDKL